MTICIATSNYLPDEGGITTFNIHLSGLLVKTGHKVVILTIDYTCNDTEKDEVNRQQDGLIIIRLKKTYRRFLKKYSNYFKPGGFNAPNWIAMGYAMREWVLDHKNEFEIDIIEASDYGGIGFFLCSNDLPPVVITAHGCLTQLLQYNYAKEDDHTRAIRQLEKNSFLNADGIIIHSPLQQHELEKVKNIRFFLATIPFQKEAFNPSDIAINLYAVTAGGLQTIKGPFILAAALKDLSSSTTMVKWIGGDTYTINSRTSVAKKLSLEYPQVWGKSFEWLDKKTNEETLSLIASSSFVIIPSLWESFNYVALEAASMGKAIVITDKTGAVYLFTHAQNAWIVPANNPQKLAEAVELLSNDPKLCEELGNNAKLMVQQVFHDKEIVEERIRIFENIIQNRRPHTGTLQEHTDFLRKYTTPTRKLYYHLRTIAKKLSGHR